MRRETVLVVAYLVVWAFSLVAFWLFMGESDAMAFSLIFFYALIPAAAAGVSFSIGRNDCFGKAKWLVPIALGIMHMLAEYLTFSMKNMVAFSFAKINAPNLDAFVMGVLFSVLGLACGIALRRFRPCPRASSDPKNV